MVQTLTFKGSFKLPSTSTSLPTKQILGPVYLTSIALFRNFFANLWFTRLREGPIFLLFASPPLLALPYDDHLASKQLLPTMEKIATPHVRKFNNQLLKNSKIAMFQLLHSYNFT